jgi:DNA-binding LacI/PurR family transcriptional regulator
MARQSLRVDPADIVNVYPEVFYRTRDESFAYIIKRIEKGVKAWVCAADHQAYDLIAALQKKGIRVPEDVSVTGFDGIRKPDWAPALTTVVVPHWEIGYTTGRRLMDIVRKRFGSPQHILVSPQLSEGETVGPFSG